MSTPGSDHVATGSPQKNLDFFQTAKIYRYLHANPIFGQAHSCKLATNQVHASAIHVDPGRGKDETSLAAFYSGRSIQFGNCTQLTFQQSNIAMENGPFLDDLPIKSY